MFEFAPVSSTRFAKVLTADRFFVSLDSTPTCFANFYESMAPKLSMAELESMMKDEIAKVRREFQQQVAELKREFTNSLLEKEAEILKVKEDNQQLRSVVSKLEEKIDDTDAYERRDCLVISGEQVPAAETGENTVEVVNRLIKDKLKINLSPTDVSTAHRLGRKPVSQAPDRRKIIMKLCRRDLKKDILYACKQTRPGFFINESLTPTRNTILFALRKMKRTSDSSVVQGTSTLDGKVFAWVKSQGSSRDLRVSVNTKAQLEEFSTKYLGKPLTDFVDDWP